MSNNILKVRRSFCSPLHATVWSYWHRRTVRAVGVKVGCHLGKHLLLERLVHQLVRGWRGGSPQREPQSRMDTNMLGAQTMTKLVGRGSAARPPAVPT